MSGEVISLTITSWGNSRPESTPKRRKHTRPESISTTQTKPIVTAVCGNSLKVKRCRSISCVTDVPIGESSQTGAGYSCRHCKH